MRRLLAGLCSLAILSACGGGSSSGSSPRDDAPASGALAGRVLETVGGTPLAGVTVTLSRTDAAVEPAATLETTDTDEAGTYRFADLPRDGVYRLDFSVPGYRDERFERILFSGSIEAELALEPVRLVDEANAGTGGLTGTITSAVDGSPLEGLELNFRRGINAREGEIVATVTTDTEGGYLVEGLGYGNVTCEIIGEGLQTTYTTLQVIGDVLRTDQNDAISPRVEGGSTRIVLTWGQSPRDLDSHLTGPGANGGEPFHVYFANKQADGVVLDVDDVTSFGPETITVDASREGVYRYSVYRYSSGTPDALSASGARVQVIRASGVVADFFVPRGLGDLWTVFDLVGGEILPVNEITERGSFLDHFAPELRPTARKSASSGALEAPREKKAAGF